MVLVTYPDSDSDSDLESSLVTGSTPSQNLLSKSKPTTHLGKRKPEPLSPPPNPRPPPLPSTLHSLYATSVRTSTTDDPTLHGGRKRQVSHVVGNWPTHVFLEWFPDRVQLARLDEMITHVEDKVSSGSTGTDSTVRFHRFLRSSLGAQLPLHISLSAPLVLSTSTKDAFLEKSLDIIRDAKVGEISVRFRALDLVPNFERSRWFVILRLEEVSDDGDSGGATGKGEIAYLLDACNRVCQDFGLSQLYSRSSGIGVDTTKTTNTIKEGHKDMQTRLSEHDSPRTVDAVNVFHISIAWTVGEPSQEVIHSVHNTVLGELAKEVIRFDRVKVKIGNVVEDVLL